ncbi:MAG: DUF4157 domain-containing protein, partial [Deltaproteobacteria bacterium]|nr:DUF4157 domain-containing protein [Deltaproteobacteria bacterium]
LDPGLEPETDHQVTDDGAADGGDPADAPQAPSDTPLAMRRDNGVRTRDRRSAMELVRASRGFAIPESVASRMAAALGGDVSHAVIHTDGAAAEAAENLDALAFTLGAHVYFGEGQYAPGTSKGTPLLAHELTHVIQDDEGRLPSAAGEEIEVSSPSDTAEREAHAMGDEAHALLADVEATEGVGEFETGETSEEASPATAFDSGDVVHREVPEPNPDKGGKGKDDKDKEGEDEDDKDKEGEDEEGKDKEGEDEEGKDKEGEDKEGKDKEGEDKEGEDKEGEGEGEGAGEGEGEGEGGGAGEGEGEGEGGGEGAAAGGPGAGPASGGGGGFTPSGGGATPQLGVEPVGVGDQTVTDEEAKGLQETTGMTAEEHTAKIQSSLAELDAKTLTYQQEAVDYAENEKTNTISTLEARGGELEALLDAADASVRTSYETARGRVTDAAAAGRTSVEGAYTTATTEIATATETSKVELNAAYTAAKEALQAVIDAKKPEFEEVFAAAGDKMIDAAKEKSGGMAAQKAKVKTFFDKNNGGKDGYVGLVRADTAIKKLPEAAKQMDASGPEQKKLLVNEGKGMEPKMRQVLTALTGKVDVIDGDADARATTANTEASTKLETDRTQTDADIDTFEADANLKFDEDEQSALDELSTIREQARTDVEGRVEEAENQFTDLQATLADRYSEFANDGADLIPTDVFVTWDQAEETIQARQTALETLHSDTTAEVDAVSAAALEGFEETFVVDMDKVQSVMDTNEMESAQLADEKVAGINDAATK